MHSFARIAGAFALVFLVDAAAAPIHPERWNPDPALPFDRPPVTELGKSTKRVFAHYMTGMPIWKEQDGYDYWTHIALYAPNDTERLTFTQLDCYNQWMHMCSTEWGASQRERPLRPNDDPVLNAQTFPSPYVMAPVKNTDGFEDNLREEIYRAIQIGIDGFGVAIFDHLACDGTANNWFSSFCRTQELLKVARQVNSELGTHFTILPQPAVSYAVDDIWHDPRELAKAMHELIADGPVTQLDVPQGLVPAKTSYVISPWDASWWNMDRALAAMYEDPYVDHPQIREALYEHANLANSDPEFWATFLTLMAEKGDQVALVPTLNGNWKEVASRPAWQAVAAGYCDWAGLAGDAAELHNNPDKYGAGKIWMGPVHTQDYRPAKGRLYWENRNSGNFRWLWKGAIENGADWVQPVTWNDYGESTELSPSTGIQYAFYDLTAYYATWFKNLGMPLTQHLGIPLKTTVAAAQPKILREVLYYFHRIHSLADSRMSFVRTTSTDPATTLSCPNGDRFYCPGGDNCPHGAGIRIQTKPMCLQTGHDWDYDDIEVVIFIKSENQANPGTLRMKANGVTEQEHDITQQEYLDNRGIVAWPFERKRTNGTYITGNLSFEFVRKGANGAETRITAVDSAFPLVDPLVNPLDYQDLLVRGGSSTRRAVVP